MNILVLTTSYPSGPEDASGAFIHSLVQALARRGHNLRVIVPGRPGCCGRRTLDGIDVLHFRFAFTDHGHRLTGTEGGIPEALRRHPAAALRLPVMMACFARHAWAGARWADVIYANWLGSGLVGGAARAMTGTPMVITLRGDDTYLAHDRPLWRRAARWVFRRCAAVTAVSSNMPALVEDLVPERIRPVLVPAFGVDARRFRPADPAEAQRPAKPRVLFVGNITRAKGVDLLIEALARCPDAWQACSLAGAGGDADRMKSLAAESGIAGRLRWLGRLPASAVPELMRRHDLLVLPSRSEGRPNVVIEAMASGLPVIATGVGGVADLVRDGEVGLIVPPDDADALAAAIARLCTDAKLRSTMASAARACIERENLTWDRTAAEFEAIFRKAVEQPA